MPKKTKKEKIIAEIRRKNQTALKTTQDNILSKQTGNVATAVFDYQFKTKEINGNPIKNNHTNLIVSDEFITIRKDIYKTIFIAGTFLAIEFIIYWRWN